MLWKEKTAAARAIFRGIKIWFLLQMKTIGPYRVAAAWGHTHTHVYTHTYAESRTNTSS